MHTHNKMLFIITLNNTVQDRHWLKSKVWLLPTNLRFLKCAHTFKKQNLYEEGLWNPCFHKTTRKFLYTKSSNIAVTINMSCLEKNLCFSLNIWTQIYVKKKKERNMISCTQVYILNQPSYNKMLFQFR